MQGSAGCEERRRSRSPRPFASSLEISHEKKDEKEGCVIRSSHVMSVQRLGVCLTNKDADAQKKGQCCSFLLSVSSLPFSTHSSHFLPILFTALHKLVFHPFDIPTRSPRPRLSAPQPYNIPNSAITQTTPCPVANLSHTLSISIPLLF